LSSSGAASLASRLDARLVCFHPLGPAGLDASGGAWRTNLFRADVLLSYQPVPGTVVFAGYGSDMVDEEAFQFRGLTRTDDTFFLKLSCLFRL
jgi:hypothetical protein